MRCRQQSPGQQPDRSCRHRITRGSAPAGAAATPCGARRRCGSLVDVPAVDGAVPIEPRHLIRSPAVCPGAGIRSVRHAVPEDGARPDADLSGCYSSASDAFATDSAATARCSPATGGFDPKARHGRAGDEGAQRCLRRPGATTRSGQGMRRRRRLPSLVRRRPWARRSRRELVLAAAARHSRLSRSISLSAFKVGTAPAVPDVINEPNHLASTPGRTGTRPTPDVRLRATRLLAPSGSATCISTEGSGRRPAGTAHQLASVLAVISATILLDEPPRSPSHRGHGTANTLRSCATPATIIAVGDQRSSAPPMTSSGSTRSRPGSGLHHRSHERRVGHPAPCSIDAPSRAATLSPTADGCRCGAAAFQQP
jgi:hypothetical protein